MKRRRSSLRSDSGQEEQSLDTEHNLRKRKSINYHDEDYYYEEEDNCNQSLTHEDRELWPVSCGDKRGMMDVQKLAKSEECIECEGRMFTPSAFENFAGRSSSRKWRSTIYSGGKPLQHWFEKGLLDTEGFKRGTRTKKKSKTFQNNGEKPAHNLRQRDTQGAVESGTESTDDSENDDGIPPGSKLRRIQEEKERNDSDHPEEKRNEEPNEMENDENVNNKGLCAPKEPDPRLIISTPEKLALQMNSIVLLQRISMTRSCSQTTAVVHQLKDGEEGCRDSEMSYYKKTKSDERENLEEDNEEPVESETGDVATNTSSQRDPVEQKIHKLLSLSAETLTGRSSCDSRTDVICSDQFEPQTMSETRSVCDSDSTHISDKVETSTSGVLTGSDVDTMDLDQLQRETLKTQLEAAREQKEASRVQKEYYTLKLRLLQGQMKAGRFSSTM